jgi:hypothetical protein
MGEAICAVLARRDLGSSHAVFLFLYSSIDTTLKLYGSIGLGRRDCRLVWPQGVVGRSR